jgi:malonyl-CoA/methylmalonyl-CoA synthetase
MASTTLPRLPIFEAIAAHDSQSIAVVHSVSGRKFTYSQLLSDVADAREKLLKESGANAVDGQRIAFLAENSYDYVGALHHCTFPPSH